MDGPYGLKSQLRFLLTSEGINFNDLKPGCVRDDDYSFKSVAESCMIMEGISVQDLKEGTIYAFLDQGKNIFGEDIDDAGEYMNTKFKMQKEKKAEDFPTLLDQWKAIPEVYKDSVYKLPEFSLEELEYKRNIPDDDPYKFQKIMDVHLKHSKPLIEDEDEDEEEGIFDSNGRPFPVKLK